MFMGEKYAGEVFSDVLGNCADTATVDEDGWADFTCEPKRVSIWVRQEAFENLVINE